MPMSEDDIVLKALADIRWPPVSESALWSEALLALGLGLVLALAVAALLRLATEPRAPVRVPMGARVADAAGLPLPERLATLAALARDTGITVPDDIRAALYRPAPETELADHASRLETVLLSR